MTNRGGKGSLAGLSVSVIMPCFNEAATVEIQLQRVLAAAACGLKLEVLVVDDGSLDGSAEIVSRLVKQAGCLKLIRHERNLGKGAALRSALRVASGDVILIQDADLEYDPSEYPRLLAPIARGAADVVYGSRFRGGDEVRALYFWHSVANRMLTFLANMFIDLNLTDIETGLKAFRRDVISRIELRENRFGFEVEVTAKIARLRPKPCFFEVGISYHGRTYNEGKKIGLRDALRALYCILRYSVL